MFENGSGLTLCI